MAVYNGCGVRSHLYGPAVDQIFATESASGNPLWSLADHQGTPRDWATLDSSGSTTIAQHTRYTAFGAIDTITDATGNPLAATSSPLPSFTGQLYDADAGLMYYRARWYDPSLGKFLNDDPLGFGGEDANLSRHIGNAAAKFTDATGCKRIENTDGWETDEWEFEEPSDWEHEQNLRRWPRYLLNVLDDVETFRWMEEFRAATGGLPIDTTGFLYRRQLQTWGGFHGQLAVEIPSANSIETEWRVLSGC